MTKVAAIPFLMLGLVANRCPLEREPISLMRAKFELPADIKLGKKSSGLICAPSGSWHWRDVSIDSDAISSAIRKALTDGGLNIAPDGEDFGDPVRFENLRLRATVIRYTLNACTPWKPTQGLVGGSAVRGAGQIEVIWELYSSETKSVVMSENISAGFAKVHASSHTELVAHALAKSATGLIGRWRSICQQDS